MSMNTGQAKVLRPSAAVRVFMQFVLLVTISGGGATVIPQTLFRSAAWRVTLALLLIACALALFHAHRSGPQFARKGRWLFYALLFISPYMAFLVVEGISALTSGVGLTTMRQLFLQSLLLFPALVGMFILAGGISDAKKGLLFILRPYVYLCLYISLAGTVAWALVHFHVVDWSAWPQPFTQGKIAVKAATAAFYSMPYYLGFILVTRSTEVLGTYRISGLSWEPTFAALFATPALFAVPFVFGRDAPLKRVLSVCLILTFLLLAFSVTNILILLPIGALLLLRWIVHGGRRFPMRLAASAVLVVIAFIIAVTAIFPSGHYKYINSKFSSESGPSAWGVHTKLLASKTPLGDGLVRDVGDPTRDPGIASVLVYWAQVLTLVALGLALFFSRRETAFLGLSLVYIGLHSLRDPGGGQLWPFFLFVIFVAGVAFSFPRRKTEEAPGIAAPMPSLRRPGLGVAAPGAQLSK